MSNTSTGAKSVKKPAVAFDVPKGSVTSKSVISELWKRVSETATHEENQWFSRATEQAGMMTGNLRNVAAGIAGLVGCDKEAGNFEDRQELATLLWFFEDQLGAIEAMIEVGMEAEYAVRHSSGATA